MADSVSTFHKRVISAIFGALIVLSLIYYGNARGLTLLCTVAIVLGVREFSRMAFRHWKMPDIISHFYWFVCILLYVLMLYHPEAMAVELALGLIVFIAGTMWLARGRASNENILASTAMGAVGLLYCVIFPFFSVRLVWLVDGAQWLMFLLLVVFFGDIFAYFGGRWFGRKKFMVNVSPNKTWEGSLSGLFGSCLAGGVYGWATFPDVPVWQILVFCVICGFTAQTGDLFLSLVKRVAQVKDSGSIMPGHGGALDRLDGIFIACPLVYAFALYVRP